MEEDDNDNKDKMKSETNGKDENIETGSAKETDSKTTDE